MYFILLSMWVSFGYFVEVKYIDVMMQLKVKAFFIKTVSTDLLIFSVNCHRHYTDTQTLDIIANLLI